MTKPFRIGLAWEMTRRYGSDAIRGIAEYVQRFGPWTVSINRFRDFDADRPGGVVAFDGILLGSDDFPALRTITWPKNIPVVAVHRMFSDIAPWSVQPNNVAIGRLVGEEFVKRGFRNLAYCQMFTMPTADWENDRIEGFRSVARRAGAEPNVYAGPTANEGTIEYRKPSAPVSLWLQSLPKPVGIMASEDLCTRHLMLAAEAIGLRVPEEAAVIGVNDEPWTEVLFGGLSSVEVDSYRAGYVAAELLHRLLLKQSVQPGAVLIPPRRLVVRRSSSTVAINDPDVVLAVRYIAENVTAGLTVEKVVDAVPLSRRTLERRFRKAVGQSILDYIRSAQVERSKRLLADPAIALPKIARVSGFSSVKAMEAIFSRLTGVTPLGYRRSMQ